MYARMSVAAREREREKLPSVKKALDTLRFLIIHSEIMVISVYNSYHWANQIEKKRHSVSISFSICSSGMAFESISHPFIYIFSLVKWKLQIHTIRSRNGYSLISNQLNLQHIRAHGPIPVINTHTIEIIQWFFFSLSHKISISISSSICTSMVKMKRLHCRVLINSFWINFPLLNPRNCYRFWFFILVMWKKRTFVVFLFILVAKMKSISKPSK